jgi:hypothetical protein
MIPKIFPRNLTARAAAQVVGNPANTRLESGVGNCFPGLEFDHRNLDRRFFPGLVFEFTDNGARFVDLDLSDPALDGEPGLKKTLSGDTGSELRQGIWFIEQITQDGISITMTQDGDDLDAMTSWRLVRSLEQGNVTIQLQRRPVTAGENVPPQTVTLSANRRNYVDAQTGVISSAYAPGELTQSLCSPWMHDFRDCACYYWASNHPDIVLAEDPAGEPTTASGPPSDPFLALTPIDWLRTNRASTAPAGTTASDNRPGQMDHYEINQRWQDLAIVLQGREISSIYQPQEPENANPLDSPDALAARLVELATLEHAVALEYLYARYSLKDPASVTDKSLRDDLVFAQHEIFLVAVSEMRHLRWANQLIWSMEHAGLLTKKVGPSLGIADQIPVAPDPSRPPQLPAMRGVDKTRPPQLRPLLPEVLQDFIAVEQPSGFLDGQYAEVLATLHEKQYPPTLEQLAARIIADGMEHFSRFRQVQVVLRNRKPADYLRSPTFPAAPEGDADGATALKTYGEILTELEDAYVSGDMEDAVHIARARALMFQLDVQARQLAARSLGVPFFPAAAAKPAKKKNGGTQLKP